MEREPEEVYLMAYVDELTSMSFPRLGICFLCHTDVDLYLYLHQGNGPALFDSSSSLGLA